MLAEQKYHSKELDGVCVSHRRETKREKMEEEGGETAGSREGGGSGAGRVVWAHCIQIKDPEGRDLTDHTGRQWLNWDQEPIVQSLQDALIYNLNY